MFIKRFLKPITIILIILLGVTIFSSCYDATPFSGNTIVFSIPEEEATIDPALNNSLYAGTLIENSFEGLVVLDGKQKVKPGVAEKWDISKDKKTYTFYFRRNAVWSDDKPVITDNFKFAWERVLDKKTKSPYSNYGMCIKGAKDFYEGKSKSVEGIKIIDDYTMKVELENPTPYFLELISTHPFMPVREDVVKYRNWSKDPEKYISNGPLNLKSIVSNESMSYERNTHYWNESSVKLDKLEVKIIPDYKDVINQFDIGKIDYIDEVLPSEYERLLIDKKAQRTEVAGTYMYIFNLSKDLEKKNPEVYKALNNKDVRRALSISINRDYIVKDVLKGGEKPAKGIISPVIKGYENKDYFSNKGDVKEAKKLLEKAGYPNGKNFPELRLLHNIALGNDKLAKAVKDIWEKELGIKIKLIQKERKELSKEIENGNFDILKQEWIADYDDPSSFLKMFETNASGNFTMYTNPNVDLLMDKVYKETDEAKRMNIYYEIEKIIIDDMPIIPIYYDVNTTAINPEVKGVTKSKFGNIIFYTGYKKNKVS